MATGRKFKVTNGLDNNANQIDNIGAAGAHLTRSGAHVLTLTTTATTNVTLPSGTVTLAKTSGETMTNLILSGTLTAGGGNGTNGQLLSSTGTGVQWINAPITGVTGSGTTNTIAYWDSTTSIASLATATYPSLTELSYVKGVTSAIQTQINNKFTLPALTSGSVLFSNGTTIAQDNANFFWDDSNNRLGVNTATPSAGVHVIYDTANQLRIGHNATRYLNFSVGDDTTLTIAGADITDTNITGLGSISLSSDLNISGNLTVTGTTTNINTTNLVVEDKNIILGDVATPSNTTADGGGITLKGTGDKTINWVNATGAWTSSEDFNLASGKVYRINGTQIAASNLSNGTTGTGSVVLNANPIISSATISTVKQTNSFTTTFEDSTNSTATKYVTLNANSVAARGFEIIIASNDGTTAYVTKILGCTFNTTVSITEYGGVGSSGGASHATYDVDISSGALRLGIVAASSAGTVYTIRFTELTAIQPV